MVGVPKWKATIRVVRNRRQSLISRACLLKSALRQDERTSNKARQADVSPGSTAGPDDPSIGIVCQVFILFFFSGSCVLAIISLHLHLPYHEARSTSPSCICALRKHTAKKILSRPRARRWFRQGQKRWNGKNGVECYVRIPHISPQIRIHITHQNWRRQHQESVCKARERSKGNAERQEKKRGPI